MKQSSSREALLYWFLETTVSYANRIAVREANAEYTYAALSAMVRRLVAELRSTSNSNDKPIGLLLERSALAYGSMWASIALARPYVPLNPTYPAQRIQEIMRQADLGPVICTQHTRELAQNLGVDSAALIVAEPSEYGQGYSLSARDWQSDAPQQIAYILFTSGSTGKPKGVPISYRNLHAFIQNINSLVPYRPEDKCSQLCELTFDFSVEEIYLALLNGATLCPARQIDLFNPAHFIENHKITVWISVPSLVGVLLRNHKETQVQLGSLRVSIFNGESLTASLAAAWQRLAPNAEIWNTYGPTECTVGVTHQRWVPNAQDLEENNVVAIGVPFEDCNAALFDKGNIVAISRAREGMIGELLLSGPQRFQGYLDTRLQSPFLSDHDGDIFYRTGDRVKWKDGKLFHIGRVDYQVKIGGHRIELMEVEHRMKEYLNQESLAVIAYPETRPTKLVLFIAGEKKEIRLSPDAVGLPAYMLPGKILFVPDIPKNRSGKTDRRALQEMVG